MAKRGTEMPLPPGWAGDSLSDFMQAAFTNTLATFVRKRNAFDLLLKIDGAFRKAGDNLHNAETPLAVVLLHRSHSAFLASCRLAMSGQSAETFPVLRTCLEYALYALHIDENAALAEMWLRRHDNDESVREVKRRFQHWRVMETLLKRDSALHSILDGLYNRTIDFGGHPNERAVTSSATLTRDGDTAVIRNQFLHGDSLALEHVLKTTAQVGLGSLMVFQLIFKERFDLLGLRDIIDELRRVL